MSGFFDSEEVRKSLRELTDLQEKIYNDLLMIPFYSDEQKRENLNYLREFLEKQKLFIFRLSLSNDPEALELKENIMESAKLFGMKEGETIRDFFLNMEKTIEDLEQSLDT
jgi:hypothetical protein